MWSVLIESGPPSTTAPYIYNPLQCPTLFTTDPVNATPAADPMLPFVVAGGRCCPWSVLIESGLPHPPTLYTLQCPTRFTTEPVNATPAVALYCRWWVLPVVCFNWIWAWYPHGLRQHMSSTAVLQGSGTGDRGLYICFRHALFIIINYY